MKQIRNNPAKRILSVLLSVAMLTMVLDGCGLNNSSNGNVSVDPNNLPQVDTTAIAETILDELQQEMSNQNATLSMNWEDYVGDFETFVYGLLSNELKYDYDVFPAFVELEDGLDIYGIAYTDYSKCYTNEDESQVMFESGFLPYCGEIDIPDEEFDKGLQIHDCDYQDETTGFVWAYQSSEFAEHCVVYGQYLKYGVDSTGHIFYETQDYDQSVCDVELGSLYSFDDEKYLYDTDFGNFVNVNGVSLYSNVDYDELEKQINLVLDEQDLNFASVDIETCAYIAQEAITTYLLSMQEETFMGFDVEYLIELANELDPTECYQITQDGLIVVNFEDVGNDASALTRWLVGTGCAIVAAVSIVGAMVFVECPPLSALSGALAGTAIEIFMQVAVSGQALDSIQWNRVALAAAAGAVSGFLGPYVLAKYEGVSYFFVDSALDGLIGGIEKSVLAWMEGEDGQAIIQQFGYGFAMGFGLSAGFKAVGKLLEVGARAISPAITRFNQRVFPRLSERVAHLASNAGSIIYKLKEVADGTLFHSNYISQRLMWRQLDRIIDEGASILEKKSFDNLSTQGLFDVDGNIISKDALKEIFKTASDGEVIGRIYIEDDIINIVKQNGMVGLIFDPDKYLTVTLPYGLVNDRGANFEAAAEIYKKLWKDSPSSMPESIRILLQEEGLVLDDMSADDIVRLIQRSDVVMHENIDLQTITLVSRRIHDSDLGGATHMGGFGLAKYLKGHMGVEFFDRFLTAASSLYATGG